MTRREFVCTESVGLDIRSIAQRIFIIIVEFGSFDVLFNVSETIKLKWSRLISSLFFLSDISSLTLSVFWLFFLYPTFLCCRVHVSSKTCKLSPVNHIRFMFSQDPTEGTYFDMEQIRNSSHTLYFNNSSSDSTNKNIHISSTTVKTAVTNETHFSSRDSTDSMDHYANSLSFNSICGKSIRISSCFRFLTTRHTKFITYAKQLPELFGELITWYPGIFDIWHRSIPIYVCISLTLREKCISRQSIISCQKDEAAPILTDELQYRRYGRNF